jgi:hypothetical protein
MNEKTALELTRAGTDAQRVVCDAVTVDKDVHLYFQIHQLTKRKVGSAGRCERLDHVCAVFRCDSVRHHLEILTQGTLRASRDPTSKTETTFESPQRIASFSGRFAACGCPGARCCWFTHAATCLTVELPHPGLLARSP